MAKSKLTAKQQLFVQEYVIDLNATAAAKRAGYSEKRASEIGYQLLQKTTVQAAITESTRSRAEKLDLDANWVLARLKLVSDRCVQGEPVLDKEGNPTGEWKFDAAGANRATELIGKHLSMFTDKHEISGANGSPLQVNFSISRPDREEQKRLKEKD